MNSATPPSPYQVVKLDLHSRQIRLVTISSGRYIDIINCHLSTASLDDLPDYYALSYVWGERTSSCQILLNGILFNVSPNLEASLRRLRHPVESRIFWIDMLCINQESVDERTHQVNLMQLIYSRAIEVFLWLGDYVEIMLQKTSLSSQSNVGQEFLSQSEAVHALAGVLKLSTDEHFQDFDDQNFEFYDRSTGLCLKDAEAIALVRLVETSWWRRIWTVQEVILPSKVTVVIGWLQFSWTTLAAATSSFYKHFTSNCCDAPNFTSTLIAVYARVQQIERCRLAYHGRERLDLLSLLHLFRSRSCTDPRDKVFGLLGLVMRDPTYRAIQANYSISVEAAYQQTFVHLLREKGEINSLVRPLEMERTLDLPTWVPDWTAKVDESTVDREEFVRKNLDLYNACGSARMDIRWPGMTNMLGVRGLLFDEVATLPESLIDRELAISENPRVYMMTLYDDIKRLLPSYVGGKSLLHAFWCLMSLDQVWPVYNDFTGRSRRSTVEDYKNYPDIVNKISFFYVPHFQMFISKLGYIGLGPKTMRAGDTIHIFLGGSVPFVLRQVVEQRSISEPQTRYEFIGYCYVEGIMDGEAFSGVDLNELGWFDLV